MPVTLSKRPRRLRVCLEAHLERPSGKDGVRVRDVSKGGVLVETFGKPPKEDDVVLQCEGHALDGHIVWRDGVWLGIELKDEMPQEMWDACSDNSSEIGANTKKRVQQIADWHERIELPKRMIELGASND